MKTIFQKIGLLLVFLLLLVGGVGWQTLLIYKMGVFLGTLLILSLYLKRRKLGIPSFLWVYIIFLLLYLAASFWVQGWRRHFDYFYMFLSGGLFWLWAFNDKVAQKYLDSLIIVVGVLCSLAFFYMYFFADQSEWINSLSLLGPSSHFLNHYNLGDFWACGLIIAFVFYLKQKKLKYVLILFIASMVIFLSQSRSALLACVGGLVYYILSSGGIGFEKYRKYLKYVFLVAAFVFVYFGLQKQTLMFRQYYVQGFAGLVHSPWGVGFGSFENVSRDVRNHVFGMSQFSAFALNIFLEVLVGIGVVGVSFLIWFYGVAKEIWRNRKNSALWGAVFVAISINFFFNGTYFIPTMFWMWMLSLGFAQRKVE